MPGIPKKRSVLFCVHYSNLENLFISSMYLMFCAIKHLIKVKNIFMKNRV